MIRNQAILRCKRDGRWNYDLRHCDEGQGNLHRKTMMNTTHQRQSLSNCSIFISFIVCLYGHADQGVDLELTLLKIRRHFIIPLDDWLEREKELDFVNS